MKVAAVAKATVETVIIVEEGKQEVIEEIEKEAVKGGATEEDVEIALAAQQSEATPEATRRRPS